jgi:hypothetical protein
MLGLGGVAHLCLSITMQTKSRERCAFPRELVYRRRALFLAHREPLLAHSGADVSVDGGCPSRRQLFRLCSFQSASAFDNLEKAISLNGHVTPDIRMDR